MIHTSSLVNSCVPVLWDRKRRTQVRKGRRRDTGPLTISEHYCPANIGEIDTSSTTAAWPSGLSYLRVI